MEQETVYTTRPYGGRSGFMKRISWSAVFAGVLIAIVTQIALSLLGIGIGLSTIDVMEESNPTAGLGVGTAIWYIVSSLLALFTGGWVAGRLASTPRTFDGIIHGVLTWCLATIVTLYFLTTTIGSIIGGAGRLVGGIVKTAGAGVAAAAPALGNTIQDQLQANGINFNADNLLSQVKQVLRQTGDPSLSPDSLRGEANQAMNQAGNAAERAAANPQNSDQIASNLFSRLFKEGQSTVSQVDRDDAVNVVMQQTGKSRAESEQIVDNWISTYKRAAAELEQAKEQAVAKARQVADQTAEAAAKGAIYGFFGLMIGLAAAGFGAKLGTDSKDEYNKYDRPVREV